MSGNQKTQAATGLAEWRLVWLKAIAEAWRDPEFEKQLLADARNALKTQFHYDLPAGIDLKVVPATANPKLTWTGAPDKMGWPPPAGQVELPIPAKPPQNAQGVAIAELVSKQNGDGCCHDPCL